MGACGTVLPSLPVCLIALSHSMAVYVLFRMTKIAPMRPQAKNSSTNLSSSPDRIAIRSPLRIPKCNKPFARVRVRCLTSTKLSRAPVQGTTTASFDPNFSACWSTNCPSVKRSRWGVVGPFTSDNGVCFSSISLILGDVEGCILMRRHKRCQTIKQRKHKEEIVESKQTSSLLGLVSSLYMHILYRS